MSHSHGRRENHKMAERKLTNLGTVVGHCGLVNSKDNVQKMREQYGFVSSIAEIHRVTANEKKKKEDDVQRDLETSVPAAAMKLDKRGRDIDGLYAVEIKAILFQVYNVLMHGKSKLRKPDYVKKLKDEMTKNIGRYESFVSSAKKT